VGRIAWLFGAGGNHFPRKIVAAADRHGALRVVSDEVGNPTYAPDAAAAMAALITTQRYGVYHLVNEGRASRYELALKTLELTGRGHIALTPIGSDEWRRAAPAPRHAVLVNLAGAQIGIRLRPWEEALAAYLAEDNSLAFAPA
jgi:dTDP-4-dehydrorhamnose reductase